MQITDKRDISLYKFGDATVDDPWSYPNVWARETLGEIERLVIAPKASYLDVFKRLLERVPDPMWVLYILVVPRGEGEAGRYQSMEPQSLQGVGNFLKEFRYFLEIDGRFNLWIRSESGAAMLIYDRHNLKSMPTVL